MTTTMTKTGKGKYEVELGGETYRVFRDSYTGLWRIRTIHGPVDWAGPFATKKEAVEHLDRHLN